MKNFVFVVCALLLTSGLTAKIDTPVTNDVQITENQQQNIFEGIGAITHRPIRLAVGGIISHGEGPDALNPLSEIPALTRVASFDENVAVITHHNQVVTAAQENAH